MNLLSRGDPNTRLMLVVDGPTKSDLDAGFLFSGAQRRMVDRILTAAGMDSDKYYVVSVEDLELARLLFAASPARVVVPLGTVALKAVTGLSTISDWRGYLIKPNECVPSYARQKVATTYATNKRCPCAPNKSATPISNCHICKGSGYTRRKGDPKIGFVRTRVAPLAASLQGLEYIIPTLSPADVQKSQLAMLPVMGADLNRAVRAIDNRLNLAPVTYIEQVPPTMGNAFPLAVDIETMGYSNTIERVGLADARDTVTTDTPSTAIQALSNASLIIAHNTFFDIPKLDMALGTKLLSGVPLWDTMLAAYMLHPDGKKGLNWAISVHLDAQRHKHLAGAEPALYNALDVRRTYDLYNVLRDKLENSGQLNFFQMGMMPALPTLMRMSGRGIPIDSAYRSRERERINARVLALEDDWPLSIHILKSPAAAARHFGLGYADEESLLRHKTKSDAGVGGLIDTLLEHRGLLKAYSTYFGGSNNMAHPNYLPGARDDDIGNKGIAYSGRPTASQPNIQNQPQYARSLFVPHPGMTFASLDWNQIELRITAALSGDALLAQDLEGDLHTTIAAALGISRDVAKTVVYLSAYLGSPKTLQDKLAVNGHAMKLSECKNVQDRLFSRYSRWSRWRTNTLKNAAEHKGLRNTFGKWAPFLRVHPAKAANFLPQSSAACILWYCLPQVEQAIAAFGGFIVTTVHDEILIEAPPETMPQAINAAREVMTQAWPQLADLRVPVKVKVGPNWGSMQPERSLWAMWAEARK